ncbi:MAG: T9SS C-terminal target domain-containing protein [Stygiobacter sp.]|nr:MAG: T9SS C-terminal target domain-containing protein [Stygiobacter sp.]
MTKYLLFFALIFSSLIFPQTVTINEAQTKYTVCNFYGTSPEFSAFFFDSAHDLGHYNVASGKWKDWASCYKISLGGVPTGYTIKNIKLTAYITQLEYTPNNFVANIKKLPNNTNLSTESSNAEPLYNTISQTGTSIGSFNYGDTLSQDIKSSITSSDFSDNYIILGVEDAGSSNNSMAKISISLVITYYLPIDMTIDNNFVDNSGNGTHGQVSIDGTTQTIPSSGISLTRNVGQNLTLSAISSQQDNQGYQRTWHTGAVSTSDWTRNGASRNPNQTYFFPVAEDDGGKTYIANLRKLYNLTFSNPGNSFYVNGNYYTNSTSVSVVEQNSLTATASNYTSDGIEYTFNGWKSDGITYGTTITPTANKTFTADYTGRPVVVSFYFGGVLNDPIKVMWTDNQNPAVTQYYIYRKQKPNGVYTTPVHIGTVNKGVGYFEDYDFSLTNTKNYDTWLEYTVQSYYTTEGTYSDDGWMTIWGDVFASMQNNALAMTKAEIEVPTEYSIGNYPNPFNPTTTINYQLPKDGMVTIKVYDIIGKEVAVLVNEQKSAGYYKVDFNASTLTSGVYIATIQASGFNKSIKLLLTK